VHFYYQNFRQKYPLDFLNAIYHGDWIAVPPESIAAGNNVTPMMGVRANPLVSRKGEMCQLCQLISFCR
jgi:hypothetical protein